MSSAPMSAPSGAASMVMVVDSNEVCVARPMFFRMDGPNVV